MMVMVERGEVWSRDSDGGERNRVIVARESVLSWILHDLANDETSVVLSGDKTVGRPSTDHVNLNAVFSVDCIARASVPHDEDIIHVPSGFIDVAAVFWSFGTEFVGHGMLLGLA
jgi:hypothetical protein